MITVESEKSIMNPIIVNRETQALSLSRLSQRLVFFLEESSECSKEKNRKFDKNVLVHGLSDIYGKQPEF